MKDLKNLGKELWGKFRTLPIKTQLLVGGMVLFCLSVGFTLGFRYALVVLLCLFLLSLAGAGNREEPEEWKWSDMRILAGTKLQKWAKKNSGEERQEERKRIIEEIELIAEHIEQNPNDLQAKLMLREKQQELEKIK